MKNIPACSKHHWEAIAKRITFKSVKTRKKTEKQSGTFDLIETLVKAL
jgi:hypothetical protein